MGLGNLEQNFNLAGSGYEKFWIIGDIFYLTLISVFLMDMPQEFNT